MLSILLLISVAFPFALYELPMPNLDAQVTGTISIQIGRGTTSDTTPITVISTSNTGGGPTTTITTGSYTETTLSSTDETMLTSTITTSSPEFQVGPTVLASMIGVALLLCHNQRVFKTKRRI